MCNKKYTLLLSFLLLTVAAAAQKAERDLIRKGNRQFKDSVLVEAETNYRKALEVNAGSAVSMYNLGRLLSQQQKPEDAMAQYESAAKIEKDKAKLAQIHHNMGVLSQRKKEYAKAIESYKMALRNNPKDDETRYNLALAQKLLKDQQQESKEDQQQKEQDQQKKEDQQNKEDQQKEQEKQQKDQKEQPQQQQKQQEMSKENAEQLLQSVMQDEKEVHDKVKKQQVLQGGRLEKDW